MGCILKMLLCLFYVTYCYKNEDVVILEIFVKQFLIGITVLFFQLLSEQFLDILKSVIRKEEKRKN